MPATVAIIGAGPLGRWLALSAARAGFRVLLEDVMPANLHHAQELLRQQLGPQQAAEISSSVSGHGVSRVPPVPRIWGPGNDEAVIHSHHTAIPNSQEVEQEASGHDFSRAESASKLTRALAPAEALETEGGGGFNPRVEPTKLSRALAPEGHVAFVSTIEEAVRNADLVIDCVPDELESKLEILWLLDRMAPPRTVLATPTTRLSITDLANCTYRPTKCIAIAAEASALTGKTEVSRDILLRTTPQTAPETVVLLDHFWRQLGFTPVFALDPASQPSS